MSNLIIREFNGKQIRHRADGFFSATDMCQASGKKYNDFARLQSTIEYIEVVNQKYYGDSRISPVESKVGNLGGQGGTWVDRRVALRLAQWISPMFALQVDEWVEELMTTGTVTIAEPVKPEPKQLPQTTVKEWAELIRDLGYQDSPMLKSALQQRMMEELTANQSGGSDGELTLLTVRANQLGLPHSITGDGSRLGRFIIRQGFIPEGKQQHGKYPVNVFKVTAELDNAICDFHTLTRGLTGLG